MPEKATLFLVLAILGLSGCTVANPSAGSSIVSYQSENRARQACTGEVVVWGDSANRAYYEGGSLYGNTASGAYMCKNTAQQAGYQRAG